MPKLATALTTALIITFWVQAAPVNSAPDDFVYCCRR